MKLLLDQNLSPRLTSLRGVFDEVVHVRHVGMQSADDRSIREYAERNGFIVVTKDADFNTTALLAGAPPKVIWVQRGNCSTSEVRALLESNRESIRNSRATPIPRSWC
jgi:predicted nuclease of predicted toxin-antitoxin system